MQTGLRHFPADTVDRAGWPALMAVVPGHRLPANCVDAGFGMTINGKPGPGSARGIPGKPDDRVCVSLPSAAVPGDGGAHPADDWPDTGLACSLADPGEVGPGPISDAGNR